MTRTLLALLVTQVLALGAVAQSGTAAAPASGEFGRAFGGTIDAVTKGRRPLSGSLGMTRSTGALRGDTYEGTLGGELLDDRMWFFAAATVLPRMQFSTANIPALDAKATAQPVDWTAVTGAFSQLRQPGLATAPQANDRPLPSSFLSLRSTSMLSDQMTLDFSFSRAQ